MRKLLLAGIAAVAAGIGSAFGASNPTTEAKAIALTPSTKKKTASVTLYKDSEKKYVAYYKMTLKKNKAYTVWLSSQKPDADSISIEAAYAGDGKGMPPLAYFEKVPCGKEIRWIVSGKEWAMEVEDFDWDDDWGDWGGDWGDDIDWGDDFDLTTPDTWTYYIKISGAKDATAKLNYLIGSDIPVGVAANPLVIKPKTTEASKSITFSDDLYYVKATLKAGQCYHLGTTGGKKTNRLTIEDLAPGTVIPYPDWAADYNAAVRFIPSVDGDYLFAVRSTKGYGATGKLRFQGLAARAIEKHSFKALALDSPKTVKPGYLCKAGSKYFDSIVDESLYSFAASKGKNYVFETSGAKVDLCLYLYDSKGNILATNTSKGLGSKDVRLTLTAEKKATYYVGVCENLPLFSEKAPAYKSVKLTATKLSAVAGDTIPLAPAIVAKSSNPVKGDPTGSAPATLGAKTWYATYSIAGRKGFTYQVTTAFTDKAAPATALNATVYTLSGGKRATVATGSVTPGSKIAFKAAANQMYFVEVSAADGLGLDTPEFRAHSIVVIADSAKYGQLKVVTEGAEGATWSIGKENVPYANGATVALKKGSYSIVFASVSGYSTPAKATVTVKAGKLVTLDGVFYNDKSDPKDDKTAGATSWTVKTSSSSQTGHTLWATDKYDYYKIKGGKDGYYYTFSLSGAPKDVVLSVKDSGGTYLATKVTKVSRLAVPKASKGFYVIVQHKKSGSKGGAYKLTGYYKDAGIVEFSKEKVTVKDTDTEVTLSVKRTQSLGSMRVKFRTANGKAKSNEQFYPVKNQYLEWADGDKSTKTITIKLIPKLLPVKSGDLDFKVYLEDACTGAKDAYAATFAGGAKSVKAVVTISNTAKAKNAAAVYKDAQTAKKATVSTEKVHLRTGTFYGIVSDRDEFPTNGTPRFAAVTLTVTKGAKASKDTFSAKVQVEGKTVSFASGETTGWDKDKDEAGRLVRTLRTDTGDELTVAVKDGSYKGDEWLDAICVAEVKLNRVGVTGKGKKAEVVFRGELYRQNQKIKDYLSRVFDFTGYYTVSLVPGRLLATDGTDAADSQAPSGCGYLTLTVDNKGKAKAAGKLADTTAVSVSATACAVVRDAESATGYALMVPIYAAKTKSCFATVIRIFAQAEKNRPDGRAYRLVADTTAYAIWYNTLAKTTYDNKQGWYREILPVGGWYDKVFNLQAYYKDYAQNIAVDTITEFPTELLSSGYKYVTTGHAMLDGTGVDLEGNSLSIAKQKLVTVAGKKKPYDFDLSINPCNLKIKFARATGVVSGSFSLWSQKSSTNKEISGFKHYGVLTIDRDDCAGFEKPLADTVLTAGFMVKTVKVDGRDWKFSAPFCIGAGDAE